MPPKAILIIMISAILIIPLIADTNTLGYVKGNVYSDDGKALTYANVTLYEGSNRVTGAQTNAMGNYLIRIPAGTYRCKVRLIGYHDLDSLNVTVEAGQTTTIPMIILKQAKHSYDLPQNTRGRISIEVTDKNNNNIVDSFCTIHTDSILVATCRPGIKGSVVFNLLPGLYTVRLNAEGYRPVWYYDVPIELGKTCPLKSVLKPTVKNNNPEPILRKYTKPRAKIKTRQSDFK